MIFHFRNRVNQSLLPWDWNHLRGHTTSDKVSQGRYKFGYSLMVLVIPVFTISTLLCSPLCPCLPSLLSHILSYSLIYSPYSIISSMPLDALSTLTWPSLYPCLSSLLSHDIPVRLHAIPTLSSPSLYPSLPSLLPHDFPYSIVYYPYTLGKDTYCVMTSPIPLFTIPILSSSSLNHCQTLR